MPLRRDWSRQGVGCALGVAALLGGAGALEAAALKTATSSTAPIEETSIEDVKRKDVKPVPVITPKHPDALISVLANSTVSGHVLVSATAGTPSSKVYIAPTSSALSIQSLSRDPSLPTTITPPAEATALGDLDLKGETLGLEPGVYQADSVSLTSDAVLYTKGTVELYVNGSFYQHGGLLYGQADTLANLGQFSPKDLRIFVVPTGDAKQSVKFEGGLTAAVVYAEDLSVRVEPNHTFIGSVIGKDLNVTNAAVYYPTELANVSVAVNSASPVAELLWFRSIRASIAQASNSFQEGEVEWNPNPGTIPNSQVLVWGDLSSGWYTWPGQPAGGGNGNGNGNHGEDNCGPVEDGGPPSGGPNLMAAPAPEDIVC